VFVWMLVNVLTFLTFAYDKALQSAHARNAKRVSERAMVFLALLGGGIGGLLAMEFFHYKKAHSARFRCRFFSCMYINLFVIISGAFFVYMF